MQHPFQILTLVFIALQAIPAVQAQFTDPFQLVPSITNNASGELQIVVAATMPAGHYLYADQTRFTIDGGDPIIPISTPAGHRTEDAFGGGMLEVYDQNGTFVLKLDPVPEGELQLDIDYQGCSATICFMPASQRYTLSLDGVRVAQGAEGPIEGDDTLFSGLTMTGSAGGYLSQRAFLNFLDRVEAGKGMEADGLEVIIQKYGMLIGIVFILGAGFLLNLTPCVLPMIPVNIAIIGAGAQASSKARGALLGSTYGLGIALTYGLLGAIVVLTGSQFGTLNASPWFNLGIAVVFVVMSLSMFGVLTIDLSRFQKGGGASQSKRGSFMTAFGFGAIAALLAGACVAPVLISVLVMATDMYQAGSKAGLLLPFLLGIGMAIPWPFAGAGLSFLPKPGGWMEKVKLFFGVIIMVAALYYGALGVRLLMPGEETAPTPPGSSWLTSVEEGIELSKQTGKPLFIDVWASWCKSCSKMSKTTFKEAAVLARLDDFVKVKFQAEDPTDPATRRILVTIGAHGQPHYAIYEPEGPAHATE